VSSEAIATTAETQASDLAEAARRRRTLRNLGLVVVAVIVADILALLFVPPFPRGGQPGEACTFPVCFINGTLEFPPPHVVLDLDPGNPMPQGQAVVTFHPSITSTIVTMWIIMAILIALAFLATRSMRIVPGGLQNLSEFAYESLENFGVGVGGDAARPYIPLFASFFVLILFCNWSGLVPPIGKLEELRAPTSDLNITIGLALVSFVFFESRGFQRHGVGGYLGKFFPVYEFRNGIGAGLIAMFVGLIELMLEFVKPVTLSMRLFGNIYGGEVALAAVSALFLVVLPVAMYGLELILNFVQALIFSILTLIFTMLAIESHDHEEGELADEGMAAISDTNPGQTASAAP
jgi:F-type H+-transporting ATPase subunit a